jgi:DNA-binding NtrC family response regulator
LPELGEEEAREELLQLIARVAVRTGGAVRAGLASCPADGADAETLLSTARTAAAAAAPGTVGTGAHLVTRMTLREHRLVLADPAMHGLYALIQRLALTELPVLITGETGTGKELAASAVHFYSRRSDKRFVTLNCAALQDTLVESELFGYERGAFSGATAAKPGLLEVASGGTVFLDEIGELSLAGQAKLLRAVETQRITRLGDVRERSIDIRIVAATNRDLQADVRTGRFRQDLLFRLGAATVVLPALRDRPREIPILARAFLEEACARAGRPPIALSVGALQRLVAHPWPGNVRELRNVLQYCAALVEGELLETWHLPEQGATPSPPSPPPPAPRAEASPAAAALPAPRRLEEELRELELRRMVEALEACGGVQKHAAQRIGMPLRTFVLKVKQHGLGRGSPGAS